MNGGGIFNGPTALGFLPGLPELPGLPGATTAGGNGKIPCAGPEFYTAMQVELNRRGYKVRTDGIWDGCCQSAFIKEAGAPLWHTDQVKQFLGKTCTTGFISQFGSSGGPLLLGPAQTVPPQCSNGSDTKSGSTPVTISDCPQGYIFDVTVKSCVPTMDPFGCGQKCKEYPALSQQWAGCMLACNMSGGSSTTPGSVTPQIPPVPGVPPGSNVPPPVEPTAASVFGENLPLILGALAIGLGAVLYFGSKSKKPSYARRNRRKRRRPRLRR